MKHESLCDFRDYLRQQYSNTNTADKYYFSVKSLLGDLYFDSLDEIPKGYIEKKIKEVKTRNKFSATRQGLIQLKKYNNKIDIPSKEVFNEIYVTKKNHRKPVKALNVDRIRRTVNQISDRKLKYAYRLALVSGLRVSEIAELRKEDITITNDNIEINIKKRKRGKNGTITCMKDNYLIKNLNEYMKTFDSSDRLFYAANTMQKKAKKLSLECHDFRRIYACACKRELIKNGMSSYEANGIVMKNLGHSRFATTKIYLYRKPVKFPKRKKMKRCFNVSNKHI